MLRKLSNYQVNNKYQLQLLPCVCVCAVLFDSLRPHGLQPATLLYPWNFPGRNTGVGCHFLFQGSFQPRDRAHIYGFSCTGRQILSHYTTWEALPMVLCAVHLVTQLCPTLCDPMDCRPPISSVHGVSPGRILEWSAMPSSRGSSQPRDGTQVSHTAGRFFPI